MSDPFTHVQTMNTCHLAAIAARLGRVIKWDPQQERIVGDVDICGLTSGEIGCLVLQHGDGRDPGVVGDTGERSQYLMRRTGGRDDHGRDTKGIGGIADEVYGIAKIERGRV
mgnify:CR=1 FL=1